METKNNKALTAYLEESLYIDIGHPTIQKQAAELADGTGTDLELTQRTFHFVRDEIEHSWDAKRNPVTCKASDVLAHKTGYCFAKSHLLAALLRANNIPAGLCYQRLTITPGQPPFSLHGLNAVWLKDFGWYRIDARGNKAGVNAQFNPPNEQLAFPIEHEGEADFPEIWAEPITPVLHTLTTCKSYLEVAENLPDIQLAKVVQ